MVSNGFNRYGRATQADSLDKCEYRRDAWSFNSLRDRVLRASMAKVENESSVEVGISRSPCDGHLLCSLFMKLVSI
jgi:hypothetical protein